MSKPSEKKRRKQKARKNAEVQKRLVAEHRHTATRYDKPGPSNLSHWEHWDEDKTPARAILLLEASSYSVARLFNNPPKASPRSSPDFIASPQGTFGYQNAILPAGAHLELRDGFVIWNGDVVLPMLVDMNIRHGDRERFPKGTSYKERVADGAVWMSLTPMEMLTQRSGIIKATGKVVVGGLGLGWFLKKVCDKEAVTEVVVVERSQELLDWYGYDLCRNYPKVKDVICDNVYAQIGHHGDCQYLLDIWPTYTGASRDRRLDAARKLVGDRLWAWGMD